MVFPRFSHETSCDFRGFASVLHAALETCAGPAVLALVQRLERESCERCEASEKVGTGGGMEVKLGEYSAMIIIVITIFVIIITIIIIYCYYYFFPVDQS